MEQLGNQWMDFHPVWYFNILRKRFQKIQVSFKSAKNNPVWCRNNRWINTIAVITNGNRKCSAKNRVSVALSTANPPQTHYTTSFPMYGMADRRFVITVALQNDICPHGNTYPINAVAIVRNRITTPTDRVCMKLCDP
jgi:hypothetical protein